ncbi:hypothetical protein SORBI_3006G120301 [Sorghum bicolor]|uniref:Uncharacterized protein n=1 Tax=Sorghum bicolor TaxID=4558 RepID=A0A1Z5REC0_SORBI|nr:hypothetical protein SORBI_3006G120301 [Sorghum bicolor]
MDTSWIMNGLGFAEKIRTATQSFTLRFGELFAKPHIKCTNCDCNVDLSNDGSQLRLTDMFLSWTALPAGVKFDPTDLEILHHLQGKSSLPNSVVLNAYDTGNRTRQRIIATGNICDTVASGNNRWHKNGSSKPVFDENGVRKGWKKILVLYKAPKKVGAKPEGENWVMHQTPMTDPPQLRRLHSSTSNTEQYTPIQEYQCGTSKMKVEAAECSSCFAELSPAIPTSDEPICSPTDALDTGLDASLPVDGPSMDLFDGLPDLDNTLPFTGTPSGGSISLHEIFGQQDSLGGLAGRLPLT